MQERTVTIDRESYRLSPNFTVFATQNPIESEGTYPLPEAQKDRFMLKIKMDWPDNPDELSLARRSLGGEAPEAVLRAGRRNPCLAEADLASLREVLETVQVSDNWWITRSRWCDGPAPTTPFWWARARAPRRLCSRGARLGGAFRARLREPRRVRALAVPVLEHRLLLRPESELEGVRAGEVLDRILHEMPVPR